MAYPLSIITGMIILCVACLGTSHDSEDSTTAHPSYNAHDVIVIAERSPIERTQSLSVISVLSKQFFHRLGMPSVGSTLCYVPGVRTEVNCQTCNYSQVRLNGFAGAYTQILVNGRPIVSPLVSLYGLEQYPTALLERIEVMRGAASVLYGSSAIAGVVNLVTRDTWERGGSITSNLSLIGTTTVEVATNATLMYSNGQESAIALTAHTRTRGGYDANGDGYTELARLRNTAIGTDASFVLSNGTLHTSFAFINEERRGGNLLDLPPDRADQAEYRLHDILFFTASYTGYVGQHRWELYAATNATTRVHYTGVDHADGWGRTRSMYGIVGGQGTFHLPLSPTIGAEYQFDRTSDAIEAYRYKIDQQLAQGGLFVQVNEDILPQVSAIGGLRVAWHNAIEGAVILWRGGLRWHSSEWWEYRLNYGEGFRAPQAFEADMHIAFASGGVSLIRLDPRLRKESARSLSLSVTHRFLMNGFGGELSFDGFGSSLHDPFVLADDGTDSTGNRILLRTNGSGAYVLGASCQGLLEWNGCELMVTLTLQRSWYDQPLAWSKQMPPERRSLRTPDLYGSAVLRIQIADQWECLTTAVLTGAMFVPHMAANGDRLVQTPPMLDCSVGVRYRLERLRRGIGTLVLGMRVSNVFDAYQRDFDQGHYRDSNYIWGPPQPRTVSVELLWSF
ncbi:MAG: TonB-dependent receptor [Chlorobiota bacterium]|nr:MAG: TonB-dependent receptor [Chlorobiota bacterium]